MGIHLRKSTKNKTLSFSSESSEFSASGSRVRNQQTLNAKGLNAKGLNAKVTKQNADLRRQHQGGLHGHCVGIYGLLLFCAALHEDDIEELKKLWELSLITDNDNSDFEPDNLLHLADILDSSMPLEGSHAGGEFFQILEEDNLQSERRSVVFNFVCVQISYMYFQTTAARNMYPTG
jgi:hypothetical protein